MRGLRSALGVGGGRGQARRECWCWNVALQPLEHSSLFFLSCPVTFSPFPNLSVRKGLELDSPPPPGALPHVMATFIPAAPGERGAAGHEPAGVLPPPLPHLLPAPAGEAAAAEEGR